MTPTVRKLPEVTPDQRQRISDAPRTPDAHSALMAEVDAMNVLQVGGKGSLPFLPSGFTVAAWNVERCLFPDRSAEHLKPFGPQIVLLSEMDNGMARTGQRDTTAEMAQALGMHFVYGVEFHELGLGGETERKYCADDFNAHGWHGNAILSAAPFERVELIRLDEEGHWFCSEKADPGQPRIGGRMAVAAIVPTSEGPICVVSTHLESNADGSYRHRQFERLLNAIDAFAPDLPVLIGGDLNTGNHLPPDYDWRKETLFSMAEARGYDWGLTPEGITTRASLISPHENRKMKLDWFAARGMGGKPARLLPSLDSDGTPLSDHECIVATVDLTTAAIGLGDRKAVDLSA
ncbi:endonuclease/exonuclease/phosphatase family protein [Nitratireductor sp. CH_MIT9313-5]|uniref:endonuclease/exonuclease/phosphatase family protein n=1 Tax=Nitratireductor sp. CH_MIT9313-5 TaxID=3107764 RepID=UPI00300A526B